MLVRRQWWMIQYRSSPVPPETRYAHTMRIKSGLAALCVVLVAVLATWVAWPGQTGPNRLRGPLGTAGPAAAAARTTTIQEGALKELRALNRLETAAFTADAIVESDNKGNPLQNLLYRDRMLLVARGRVVAGVDLASLSAEDVTVDVAAAGPGERRTLAVRLRAPEILGVALENDATRVYDRTLGLLSKGDKDLETRLRREAEAAVRRSACRAHLLEAAERNAAAAVRRTMALAGFASVRVDVSPPAAPCG